MVIDLMLVVRQSILYSLIWQQRKNEKLCHHQIFAFNRLSSNGASSSKTSFRSLEIWFGVKHIKSKYFGKVNIWEQCEFCLCCWLYCYQSRRHVTGCLATTTTSITMIYFIHYFKEVSYLGLNKTNLWKKVVSQNLLMITCIIMYNVTCCKNYILTLPHAQLSVFKKYYISVFPKLHSCKVL